MTLTMTVASLMYIAEKTEAGIAPARLGSNIPLGNYSRHKDYGLSYSIFSAIDLVDVQLNMYKVCDKVYNFIALCIDVIHVRHLGVSIIRARIMHTRGSRAKL